MRYPITPYTSRFEPSQYTPKPCKNAQSKRYRDICEGVVGRERAGFATCTGCQDSLSWVVPTKTDSRDKTKNANNP